MNPMLKDKIKKKSKKTTRVNLSNSQFGSWNRDNHIERKKKQLDWTRINLPSPRHEIEIIL